MFIRSFKLRRPGLVLLLTALIAVGAVLLLAHAISGGSRVRRYQLGSEAQRQQFLADMGWEVPEDFESMKNVVIPQEWNDIYESYNALQREQGFDLSPYRGKTVQLYTYRVKNYPGQEDGVVCDLMVYQGELIGGDVCSVALDGFMQGLRRGD